MNPTQNSSTVQAIKSQLMGTGSKFASKIVQPGKKKMKKKGTPPGKAPVGNNKLYRGSGQTVTLRSVPKGPISGSRKGIKSPVFPDNTGF